MDSCPSGALFRTVLAGDVVGVQFSQEEELALFMPHSGDVLLCSLGQWQRLGDTTTMPVSELESTLLTLGARLSLVGKS